MKAAAAADRACHANWTRPALRPPRLVKSALRQLIAHVIPNDSTGSRVSRPGLSPPASPTLDAPLLTATIKRARHVNQLFTACSSNWDVLNHIHIAAALATAVKLDPRRASAASSASAVDALADRFKALLPQASGREVATVLWSLAKLGRPPPRALLAAVVAEEERRRRLRSAGGPAAATGAAGHHALAGGSSSSTGGSSGASISRTDSGVGIGAGAGAGPAAMLLADAAPQAVANIMWALGTWRAAGPPDLLPALLARAAASLPAFTPHDTAHVLWGLAHVGARPRRPLLAALLAHAAAAAPATAPQGLAMMAWACRRLRAHDSAFLAAAAAAFRAQLAAAAPGDVALFAASLAGLRYRCPRLLRDVAEHVAAVAAGGGVAATAGAGAATEAVGTRGQEAGGGEGSEPSTSGRGSGSGGAWTGAGAASEAGARRGQAAGLTPARGWSEHTRTQLLVAFASLRFRHEAAVAALLAAEAEAGGGAGGTSSSSRSSRSGLNGRGNDGRGVSLRGATFMWCLARLGAGGGGGAGGSGSGSGSAAGAAAEAAGEALLREAEVDAEVGIAGPSGTRSGAHSAAAAAARGLRPGAVQPSHAAVAAWSAERLGLAAPLRRRLAALAAELLAAALERRLAAVAGSDGEGVEGADAEAAEEEWAQGRRGGGAGVGDPEAWAGGQGAGRRRPGRGAGPDPDPQLLSAGDLDATVMALWVLGRRGPEAAAAEPAAGRLLDAFAAAAPRLLPRLSLRQLPLVLCAYVQLRRGDAGVLGTAADMMLMGAAAQPAGGAASASAASAGAAARAAVAAAGERAAVASAEGPGRRGPALAAAVSQDAREQEEEGAAGDGRAGLAGGASARLSGSAGDQGAAEPAAFLGAGEALTDVGELQAAHEQMEQEVEEEEVVLVEEVLEVDVEGEGEGEEAPGQLLEWEDGEEAGMDGLAVLNPDSSDSDGDSANDSRSGKVSSSGGGGGGLLGRLPRNGLAMVLWALASSGYASPQLMQRAALAVMRLFAPAPAPQAPSLQRQPGREQQQQHDAAEDGASEGPGGAAGAGGGGAAVRSRWAALTLWAFAAADCYSPLLYDTLLAAVLHKVSRLGPGRVAVVLWACAVAGHYQRDALERLCAALQHTGAGSSSGSGSSNGSRGAEAEPRLPPASFTQGHWAVAHLTAGVALAWRGPSAAELRALAPRLSRHQAAVLLWGLAVQQLVLAGAGGGRRFAACLRVVLRRLAAPPGRGAEGPAGEAGWGGAEEEQRVERAGTAGGGSGGVGASWEAEARVAWQQEDATKTARPAAAATLAAAAGAAGAAPLEAGVALIVAEAVALLLASPYPQVRAEAEAFLRPAATAGTTGTGPPGGAPELQQQQKQQQQQQQQQQEALDAAAGAGGAAGGRKPQQRGGRQHQHHQHYNHHHHRALVEQLQGCWQRAQRRRHPLQEAVAVAARQLGYSPRLLRTHPMFPLGLPAAVELPDFAPDVSTGSATGPATALERDAGAAAAPGVASADGGSTSSSSGGGVVGGGGRRAVLLLAERSDFATNDGGQPLGPLFTTVQLLQEGGWCVAVVVADQFAALRQPGLRARYVAHLLRAAADNAAPPDQAAPHTPAAAAVTAAAAAEDDGPDAFA